MKERPINNNEQKFKISPAIKDLESAYSSVEINGYKTYRQEALNVNGVSGTWHLMKVGGRSKYEVFFNPEENKWLKTTSINPDDIKARKDILRRGAEIERTVLRESGLTSYAEQVEDCVIKRSNGTETYGHKTKHIGPTVEYLLKELKHNQIDRETSSSLSRAYIQAFNLAARLYAYHGIWMSDPNPGNIVLNFDKPNDIKVTMIDFESQDQYRRVDKTNFGNAFNELFGLFEQKADAVGIYISPDDPDITSKANLTTLRKDLIKP